MWVGHRLDHSGRTQWLLLNLRNKVVVIIITQETEGEAKSGAEPCLYVKVSMEGAPYLRKIDLKTYKSYVELSSALEEMFSCFTTGIVVYKSLSLKIIIHVSVTELFHFLQVSLGLTEGVAEMG